MTKKYSGKKWLIAFLLVFTFISAVKAETRLPISVSVSIISLNKDLAEKWEINQPQPNETVEIPAADLLAALADLKSAELKSKTQLITYNAQKNKLDNRRELVYLERSLDGELVKKTTGKAVGPVTEVLAVINEDGKVTVDLDYQITTALPAENVDPNSLMRIGKPLLTPQSIKTRVSLTPGQSAIIGQLDKVDAREFVIVRADVLSAGHYKPIMPNNKGILDQTLELWEKGERELAVKKFFMIDWKKENIVSGDSVLRLSEDQFFSLPSRERSRLSKEAVDISKQFRKIAYAAKTEAIRSLANNDYTKAEVQLESVIDAGKYLMRSGTLSTLKMAGETIVEGALLELIDLYSKTNQTKKQAESEEMLAELR